MGPEKPSKSLGSILVIGGCGFLGHHIVSQLLESYDVQVSVFDLKTEQNRYPSASYYDGDITSEASVRSVLQETKPAIIIHTASPAFVADDGKNHALYKKVNIDGTRNLLDQAAEAGCVKAFVYTSSGSVVHDQVADLVNVDERWPVLKVPEQREYYAHSKAVAEELVLAANRKHKKMLTVALRPAGIFGEGDMQLIPKMLKAYEERQTKFQLGDNTNLFEFTYVGNVAYAHILAAIALINTHALSTQPLDHERVDGEAFFITNGTPTYFWDFARMVWSTAGDKTEPSQVWVIQKDTGLMIATVIEWLFWLAGGRKPNLTRKIVNYSSMTRFFNIDKAKSVLGYTPQFSLEEGIKRSVKWMQDEGGKEHLAAWDKKRQ